jgi:hypothetical protein
LHDGSPRFTLTLRATRWRRPQEVREYNAAIVAKLKRYEVEMAAYHVSVQDRWTLALVRYCLRVVAYRRAVENATAAAVAANEAAVAEVRQWNAEVEADYAMRLKQYEEYLADVKARDAQVAALTARRHELEAREKDRYGELVTRVRALHHTRALQRAFCTSRRSLLAESRSSAVGEGVGVDEALRFASWRRQAREEWERTSAAIAASNRKELELAKLEFDGEMRKVRPLVHP